MLSITAKLMKKINYSNYTEWFLKNDYTQILQMCLASAYTTWLIQWRISLHLNAIICI